MTYKTCRLCHRSLPNTREYFKRLRNKNGIDRLTDVCKQCIDYNRNTEDWKDGKLICHICHQYLDIENFDKSSSCKYRNLHDKRCKKCKLLLNRKSILNKSTDEKLKYILSARLSSAKERSKKRNIEFSLTLQDLYDIYTSQQGKCALSGIVMTFDVLSGRTSTNISIDRIDPTKGYTRENVWLVCMAVNEMKNNRSITELKYFCEKILENNK